MFDLDKFKEGGYYINTPTLEVFKSVLEFLEENDIKWQSGDNATKYISYYDRFQEHTCIAYSYSYEGIYYDPKAYFKREGYEKLPLNAYYWVLNPYYGFYDTDCQISSHAFDLAHAAAFSWKQVKEFVEHDSTLIPVKIDDTLRESVPFYIEKCSEQESIERVATQIGVDSFYTIIEALELMGTNVRWVWGQPVSDSDAMSDVLSNIENHSASYLIHDEDGLGVLHYSDSDTLKDICNKLTTLGVKKTLDNETFVGKVLDFNNKKYIN